MKVYKMDGTEKDVIGFCSSCENGEKFTDEEVIKCGKYESDVAELSCGVCNTKYKFKKKIAEKLFNEHCMGCPHLGFERCENEEKDYLCFGTTEKITTKILTEGEKMVLDLNLTGNRQLFKETGFCPEHSWSKSNGITTSEGKFVFESCVICKTGKVDYNGKVVEDHIMKLVNFIAHQGIENEKRMKVKQDGFAKIDIAPELNQDINLDKLFVVDTEPVGDYGFV